MQVITRGHRYQLRELDGITHSFGQQLQFVQREPLHPAKPGTTNQEVCRALIDRVKVLDAEKPWRGNASIIKNLRDVIVLHEMRALERKQEKAGIERQNFTTQGMITTHIALLNIPVEEIPVGDDGHWEIPL